MLYELLTGHTPFEGQPMIVLYNVLHTAPDPLRKLREDIPADLEAICLKALAKKPEERYADCQALADELGRWLEGTLAPGASAATTSQAPWWNSPSSAPASVPVPPPVMDEDEASGFLRDGALTEEADGQFDDLPGTVEAGKPKKKSPHGWAVAWVAGWRGRVGGRWPMLAVAGAVALLVLLGIIIVIKWNKSSDGKSGEVIIEIKKSDDPEGASSCSLPGECRPASPHLRGI